MRARAILENMRDVNDMPEGRVKEVILKTMNDLFEQPEMVGYEESDFLSSVGGNLYAEFNTEEEVEPVDDEAFIDIHDTIWDVPEVVTDYDDVYFIFWAVNNSGGPCLYAEKEGMEEEDRRRIMELFPDRAIQ